jgi:two-component system phosphate regulon response regulator OmpR
VRKILLIDDHKATLFSLGTILRNAGYCCITASKFEEAERAFAADHIDLVVVDHGLPGTSGASLSRHLKNIRPVPILMLSGNVELGAKPDCVDVLLPKPQAPDVLLETIERLLERSNKSFSSGAE